MNTTTKAQTPSAAADKTAHTPGPWKATTHRYPDGLYNGRPYITTESGEHVAQTFMNEAGEANARLIAAAPTMLDALEDIANFGRSYGITDADAIEGIQNKARHVIKQAKGE